MRLTIELEDADMANIGGIYLWTQTDYNRLMVQLATMQAAIKSIQSGISKLLTQEQRQMSALDDLSAAVQQTQNLEQSAVTLIQGLAKQITDAVASNDSAALTALASQLNSSAAELAAAVTANTPASPDPNAPQVNPLSGRR